MNDVYYRFLSLNIQKYLKPSHLFIIGDIVFSLYFTFQFSAQNIPQDDFVKRMKRFHHIYNQVMV
jgi:hypothetical protein